MYTVSNKVFAWKVRLRYFAVEGEVVGSVKTFGNKRRGDHSPDIPRDETLRSSNAPLISREAAAYFKGPPLLLVILLVYCNYGKHRPWPLYHASLVFQPVTIFIYSTSFEISARRKWKNSLSSFFVRAHLEWSTKKKIRKLWITYIRNIYPRRNAFTPISRRANSNKINEERLLRRLIPRSHISREPILITRTLTILERSRRGKTNRGTETNYTELVSLLAIPI